MSLVEVTIAIALVGILLASTSTLIVTMNNFQRQISSKAGFVGMVEDLRQQLSTRVTCQQTLAGQTLVIAAPTSVSPVTINFANQQVANNTIVRPYNAFVRSLNLVHPQFVINGTGGLRRYLASMDISAAVADPAQQINQQLLANMAFRAVQVARIYVEINNANVIQTCYSMDTSSFVDNACASMGGTFNPLTNSCNMVGRLCATFPGAIYNAVTNMCDIDTPTCLAYGWTPTGSGGANTCIRP